MIMGINNLHAGYVLRRDANKERVRLCIPATDKLCEICSKSLKGVKCVRHEKGNLYIMWECVQCYSNSLVLEVFEPEVRMLQ